jgi:hypothetical protein
MFYALVDVLEEPDLFPFDPEDGGSVFLHIVSIYLPNCMTSYFSIYIALRRTFLIQMLMFADLLFVSDSSFSVLIYVLVS